MVRKTHLISDSEFISYLEGSLTPDQERNFISRLKANGEMDTLYHLREAWLASMESIGHVSSEKDDSDVTDHRLTHLAAKDKIL